jgi:aspartyl protease family protein
MFSASFRASFLFIVFVGLIASGLSNCGSTAVVREAAAGSDQRTISVDTASEQDEPGSFHQASGAALTLKREWDGHFYADTQINGTSIRMLVDTGASSIALSREDARRAGLGISIGMPNVVGRGAGGDVKGEYVTLDRVSLGGESAQGVSAIVLDGGEKSLLGQSFLSKFASVEIKGDTMVLR